jgi:hypothetical protein
MTGTRSIEERKISPKWKRLAVVRVESAVKPPEERDAVIHPVPEIHPCIKEEERTDDSQPRRRREPVE